MDSSLMSDAMNSPSIRKAQGSRLAKARAAAGYKSARAAATENNWPTSTYNAHETGRRTIGQDDAERYARRFRAAGVNVSAKSILFGDAEPELLGDLPSDPVLQAAWESTLYKLGLSERDAEQAAAEILAVLTGDIKPAFGLTKAQAIRQRVADILAQYPDRQKPR